MRNSTNGRAGLIRALGSSACLAIAFAMPMQEAAAQDPVGGAIVGGATGAIIGGVIGGGRGAAIGAIIGGATGAAIGAEGELRPGGYRYYQDACYQQQPGGAWLAVSPEYCGLAPAYAQDSVGIAVDIAPPPLPVYDQPPIPAPGYIWTPGYWAWDDLAGYYWVPATWVLPPGPELLWTPGYWGWNDGVYAFHEGYWGPEVGFYGGISYGYGYTGVGYEGGYWRGSTFFYNRTVNNISNVQITNVYNKTVVNNATTVSYNGGAGGTRAHATPQQIAAANQQHVPPTHQQTQHVQMAAKDRSLSLNNNQGHPTVAATTHAAQLSGAGVVAAHPGTPVAAIEPQGHHVGGAGSTATGNAPASQAKGGPGKGNALPGVQQHGGTNTGAGPTTGNSAQPSPPHAAVTPQPPPPHAAVTPQPPPPHAAVTPQPPPPHAAVTPQPPPPHAAVTPQPPPPHAAVTPQPPPPHAAVTPTPPPPHAVPPTPPQVAGPAPHPAGPPPRPPGPTAKPKCEPGQKC
jgi:WXXGXW repeat (2 copies)/YMGG-like Gly-zipper